jgi:hypothetical protein
LNDVGCATAFVTAAAVLGLLGLLVGFGMLNSPAAPVGAVLIGVSCVAVSLAVVVFAIAQHAGRCDALTPKPIDRTAFRPPTIVVRSKLRCPYCHDGLAGQTLECGGCRARYHEDCLEEARGCTTLGCQNKAPRRTVRA